MERRVRRLSLVLHELRAARELPGCRRRVPPGACGRRSLPSRPLAAGGVRPVPRGLPGPGRARRRASAIRRRVRMAGAPQVALARHRVPPGLLADGRDRRRGGPALRPVRTARGVPVGHPGEHLGHRGVLRAVLPPRVPIRMGCDRGGDLPDGGSAGSVDTGRVVRRRGRRPRDPVLRAEHAVVAVLPRDHARVDGGRQHRDQSERPAAPADHAARRDGGDADPSLRALRARAGEPSHGRADHRRRQRQRRDDRARPGRGPRRCRGDRPAAVSTRSRPSPRPPLSGPARDRAHRGRSVVPPRHRAPLRPRPLRDPRFAHGPRRSVVAAVGELPAHPRSDGGGPRAPEARGSGLDVPLLPAGGGGPLRGRAHPDVRRPTVPRAQRGCRPAAPDRPDREHAARGSRV